MPIEDLLAKKIKKAKSRALDLNAELEKQLRAAGIKFEREVEFKVDESATWIYRKLTGQKWKWDRTEKARKWRVDFYIESQALVVEVDGSTYGGGGHNRGASLENQYVRDRMLERWGYAVMRVTRNMILQGVAVDLVRGGSDGRISRREPENARSGKRQISAELCELAANEGPQKAV